LDGVLTWPQPHLVLRDDPEGIKRLLPAQRDALLVTTALDGRQWHRPGNYTDRQAERETGTERRETDRQKGRETDREAEVLWVNPCNLPASLSKVAQLGVCWVDLCVG